MFALDKESSKEGTADGQEMSSGKSMLERNPQRQAERREGTGGLGGRQEIQCGSEPSPWR